VQNTKEPTGVKSNIDKNIKTSAVDVRTRVKNQVKGCGSGRVGDQEKVKKSTHPTASGPPPP